MKFHRSINIVNVRCTSILLEILYDLPEREHEEKLIPLRRVNEGSTEDFSVFVYEVISDTSVVLITPLESG